MPSKVTPFPVRPGQPTMGFAQYVSAAASEYARQQAAKKNQSGGSGGTGGDSAPGMTPQQTTVSPTFQQDFTAQVSPAINVQTGGGTITAATEQRVASEQQARGGGSTAMPPGMPGMPGTPSPTPTPLFPQTATNRSVFERSQPQIQQAAAPTNYTPYIFAALGAIALLYWMNKNKR